MFLRRIEFIFSQHYSFIVNNLRLNNLRTIPSAVLLLLTCGVFVHAQTYGEKDQKATSIGRIGLTITNIGVLGNSFRGPFVTKNEPSLEYPLGSGIEHLFDAGLWIGAEVNGNKLVSTGAAGDDANGYDPGNAGYEFTSTVLLKERSTLENAQYFSPLAVSHQDFVATFSDSSTRVPNGGPVITDHAQPMYANVRLETYAWNFPFAEYFVLLNYNITNASQNTWKEVYIANWGDYIVRNMKVNPSGGTDRFSHSAFGYIDSLQMLYAYDYDAGPAGFTDSYVAPAFVGGEWRGALIHPKAFQFMPDSARTYYYSAGRDTSIKLRTFAQFWGFRSTDLELGSPKNDNERYFKMSTQINSTTYDQQIRDKASNLLCMLSLGPIPEVRPGESFNVVLAIVCAKKFGDRPSSVNDSLSRVNLIDHLGWALRAYNGEDANGNGLLEEGEDTNLNGRLDRYRLPEPPVPPKIKVIPSDNSVTIYWDNRAEESVDPISRNKDFEGYRIYRTNSGNELTSTSGSSDALIVMGEFDSTGNGVGTNGGFNSRGAFERLATPVTFPNDTTKYYYKYTVHNLLNGWQYLFSVTAFDEGDVDRNIEPLESSRAQNLVRVIPGTVANNRFARGSVGVYPNPYYAGALWNGTSERDKKIYFNNLPDKCEIKIYTLAGETVDVIEHDASTYKGGDVRWFTTFSGGDVLMAGGEHAWDMISRNDQSLATGLYLFSVKDLSSGEVQVGKFVVIK